MMLLFSIFSFLLGLIWAVAPLLVFLSVAFTKLTPSYLFRFRFAASPAFPFTSFAWRRA